MLRFERNLRDQIERLSERLEETKRDLDISPENVYAVVEIALALAGQPPLTPAALAGVWPDPVGERRDSPVFQLPPLTGSWARCSEGLAHPHTGALRPITFDHTIAKGRDDVVLVHLNHRLVQMALRLLRAEVWSGDRSAKLNRVAARVVPDHLLREPLAVAHARLVVTSGDGHRLHEEIVFTGGEIREGRFRRIEQGRLQEALAAATDREPTPPVRRRLTDVWDRSVMPGLKTALEARMRERETSLRRTLDERATKEVENITVVLDELEGAIRKELAEPDVVQLALFSEPEREQYSRNADALRARLERIPEEKAQETAAIRARYAAPESRLFPVAVTFLVPARLA